MVEAGAMEEVATKVVMGAVLVPAIVAVMKKECRILFPARLMIRETLP